MEPYSRWILVAINGVILLAGILFFILYLIIYRLCCQGRFILEPLWPVMTAYEYDVIGVETKKYMDAVLKGRAIIGELQLSRTKVNLYRRFHLLVLSSKCTLTSACFKTARLSLYQ